MLSLLWLTFYYCSFFACTTVEWANGASAALNWNKLARKSWVNRDSNGSGTLDAAKARERANAIRKKVSKFIARRRRGSGYGGDDPAEKINAAELLGDAPVKEKFVTKAVADQIGFGENLLEIVYPGKKIYIVSCFFVSQWKLFGASLTLCRRHARIRHCH